MTNIGRALAVGSVVALAAAACVRMVFAPAPHALNESAVTPPPNHLLHVGSGQEFETPSAAAAAVQSGDWVQIAAGTYSDCAVWPARVTGLTIEGEGDVVLTDKTCQDKAIFVIAANDVTVRGITFTHAKALHHNGAGIRSEGRNLTVEHTRFVDNEEGILAASIPQSTIAVRDSYFRGNGNCIEIDGCAHGLYVGRIAKLIVERSQFFEQNIGHHIKSRAALTELTRNIIEDGASGTASYLVDIPDGGGLIMRDNRLQKGAHSDNPLVAVILAEESNSNPASDIIVENNRFTNDLGRATIFVRNLTTTPALLTGNRLIGPVTALQGAGTVDASMAMAILP